jgi:hypothetical protein
MQYGKNSGRERERERGKLGKYRNLKRGKRQKEQPR